MRKINIDKKEKWELDIQKKVNHPRKELNKIKDLLTTTMISQVTHQKNVGVMLKLNSIENVTISISMVIELINVKRNQNLKANVTNERRMDINIFNAKQRH